MAISACSALGVVIETSSTAGSATSSCHEATARLKPKRCAAFCAADRFTSATTSRPADRAVSKIVGADLNAMAWAAPMVPVPTTPIPTDCGIAELQEPHRFHGGGQILRFFVC